MSNLIKLGIFILIMYILQYFLTFLQMNSFKKYFNMFLDEGKVAIGIQKGAISSGAIAMFCVDDIGYIKRYAYIQGVSVLARFKEKKEFININIRDLDEEMLKGLRLHKNLVKAILNAKSNYIKVQNGEEIELEKSPLQKAMGIFKK